MSTTAYTIALAFTPVYRTVANTMGTTQTVTATPTAYESDGTTAVFIPAQYWSYALSGKDYATVSKNTDGTATVTANTVSGTDTTTLTVTLKLPGGTVTNSTDWTGVTSTQDFTATKTSDAFTVVQGLGKVKVVIANADTTSSVQPTNATYNVDGYATNVKNGSETDVNVGDSPAITFNEFANWAKCNDLAAGDKTITLDTTTEWDVTYSATGVGAEVTFN